MKSIDTAADANPTPWYRGDITGLRTLAIVPVVAFHAGIPGLDGGFIGVDIFYVISGFLITTNLIREASNAGRINLLSFWGKRIRRLAPAATVMVGVTLLLTMLLISPLRWGAIGKQAAAAMLNLSNFQFANQATDYFTADRSTPSPLLHTWSLGVEEQFYVVWPILVTLGALFAWRQRRSLKAVLATIFGVVIVGSFVLSLVWTVEEPQSAFYLLPSRAWEFAAAGLVALLLAKGVGSARMRSAMSWGGIAIIVAGVVFLPKDVAFPGTAALVPVIGTLLVLLGGIRVEGAAASTAVRLLETRPMQWIGKVSYSWYLWHWPFIILATYALRTDSVPLKIAMSVLALGVGALTYYFVENPVRFSPRLQKSVVKTFVFFVVSILVVGGAGAAISAVGVAKSASYARTLSGSPAAAASACIKEMNEALQQRLCVMGDPLGKTTIVLAGDSHANQWRVALSDAAKDEGIRLVVRARSACSAIPIATLDTNGKGSKSCAIYQAGTVDVIRELRPQAVILAQAEGYLGRIVGPDGARIPEAAQVKLWRAAHDGWLNEVSEYTDRIGTFRDNPRLHYDPNDCMTKLGGNPQMCASPRADALDAIGTLQAQSEASDVEFGVTTVFSTTDALCDATTCRVFDSGVPVYRDYNHLSRAWTYGQLPNIRSFVKTLTQ